MTVKIPGYKILGTLGKGGMATVYLAEHELFQRKVALKVMAHDLTDDSSFGDRFMREARIVSQLVHPNIVTVYDVGVYEGNYYLSMEFIDGKDLKHARRQLSLEQKIHVILDIAKALEYAGNKGYVHRDIKPENIMLYTDDSRAVLTDFGIARAAEMEISFTQTGAAIGTPHYMSPEQAKGQSVDIRSDIYGLGVVFYLLLVGCVPYDAESAVAIGIKHITDPIPELPEGLEALQPIINKMMAKLPQDRYQRPAELVRDLSRLDITALAATVEAAAARAEESLGSASADAPTIVSRAAARGGADLAIPSRPGIGVAQVADADDPTPVIMGEPFQFDDQDSNLWPWLAGFLVLLAVVSGVLYSQHAEKFDDWVARVLSQGEIALPTADPASEGASIIEDSEEGSGEEPTSRTGPGDATALSPTAANELEARLAQQQQIQQWLREGRDFLAAGILTEPAGDNARARFEQVLAREPDNAQARQGLEEVVARLAELAAGALANDTLDRAETLLSQAADLDPDNARIAELRQQLAARSAEAKTDAQVTELLAKAEAQMREAAYFTPPGQSAYHYFSQVQHLRPDSAAARNGISRTIQEFGERLFNLLAEDHFEAVRGMLSTAQSQLPNDGRLTALQERVEEVIAEKLLAQQPRVVDVVVTGSASAEEAAGPQPATIQADRTIWVSFRYENFKDDTSVIHAVLMDGTGSLQIAQVPVIVTGEEGTKAFRIDRPVEGFPSGRYAVALTFKGNRLAMRDFQVE